jgi:hypothetical protein
MWLERTIINLQRGDKEYSDYKVITLKGGVKMWWHGEAFLMPLSEKQENGKKATKSAITTNAPQAPLPACPTVQPLHNKNPPFGKAGKQERRYDGL